ncbi:hypothetical protein [Aquibacillus rhizosphaerae]|uniref:Yip1 domain-containing protein n=1 Tax=Aquibacillus rhizosphaerae TaxID=3051431 RepID=A0ABT7L4B1_9BACI|nr:hypothetical protein [Aquibacillus sp. LR5S19]MDL4840214.1 hypothetical protein [Aquibacillus sp. LR5S19]
MSFKDEINDKLSRKVMSAAISGTLFAVLLGLIVPNPFGEEINSIWEYFHGFILSTPIYLLYSIPVIFVYGILTSMISEYIGRLISNYTSKKLEIYISIVLHLLFGLILLWYSLLASFLFFTTDYILSHKNIGKWKNAFKSLGIPILVFILFMGGVYIFESELFN